MQALLVLIGVIAPENITIGSRIVGTRARACADELDMEDMRSPTARSSNKRLERV